MFSLKESFEENPLKKIATAATYKPIKTDIDESVISNSL
jgi:hypothetical protein